MLTLGLTYMFPGASYFAVSRLAAIYSSYYALPHGLAVSIENVPKILGLIRTRKDTLGKEFAHILEYIDGKYNVFKQKYNSYKEKFKNCVLKRMWS